MLRPFFILFVLMLSLAGHAQRQQSQLLAAECRQEAHTDSSYTMVWVFPTDYWTLSYSETASMSQQEIQQVVDWLSPYTLVLVADGNVAPMGNVVYNTKTQLSDELLLIDQRNKPIAALEPEDINEKTAAFVAVMKPVIAQMLGQEAKNIHFFLFPAVNTAGDLVVNPSQRGKFGIKVRQQLFEWHTPFAALSPAKRCPIDGESMNGTWEFCPFHGVALMPAK